MSGRKSCERFANELISVITVKDLNELNKYIELGYCYAYIKREINPELYSDYEMLTFRNKKTGLFETGMQREPYGVQYGKTISFPENEWDLIQSVKLYEGIHPECYDWGAYVIPKEVKPMQKVYIPELIEDFLLTEFWYSKRRAFDGVGVWTGESLEVDKSIFDSYYLIG